MVVLSKEKIYIFFDKFQEFKTLIENKIGKKIKVLRIDDGGEVYSKAFEWFCR